jgi:hypothetical protein
MPRIRSERPAFDLHYPHVKQGRASLGVKQSISASPSSDVADQ